MNNEINIEKNSFDIKKVVARVLNHWVLFLTWFIIFTALGVGLAIYVHLSHTINAMILVDDTASSPSSSGSAMGMGDLTDISSLFGMQNNALNEQDILNSVSLMTNTVKALNLNICYYRNDNPLKVELYDEAPFEVKIQFRVDSVVDQSYVINIQNGKIHITNSSENVDKTIPMGGSVKLPQYFLTFVPKPNTPISSNGYVVKITPVEEEVESLFKNYTAVLSDKQATTVDLTLAYPNAKKGEAIINELMKLYLQQDLQDKVQIADSTIQFIDGRLILVGKKLNGVEDELEAFKRDNKLADVEEQSKALIDNASDFQKQLNQNEIELSVVNDLEKYLNDPKNKKIIPSSLASQNAGFADAIEKYNELLLERDRQGLSYNENNPVLKNIDLQTENFRINLLKGVETYKKGLMVSQQGLNNQNGNLNSLIAAAPAKERTFLDFSREQDVTQHLYMFLLQKREETAIAKTSTISSSRIIDPAKSDYKVSLAKRLMLLLSFVFLGIAIPALYLYIKDILRVRIMSKDDISNETTIPVVGEVSHSEEKHQVVIQENSRTTISEQFRAMRTNLQYLLSASKSNVIMVTSSMSGEGKSFVSLNLGIAIALSGKKVLFVEMDLRRPKLTNYLGLKQYGFTNYVVSDTIKLEDIIQPIPFSENCFLISAGAIPPNPAELLLSDKLDTMIETLKSQFDYIIIDSAPIGLIADALLLEKFADITLYILRQNFTLKKQLDIPNSLIEAGKLKKTYLVVNDIASKKAGYDYGYGYGYGYGNGYSYGYGAYGLEVEKRSLWSRLFKKKED